MKKITKNKKYENRFKIKNESLGQVELKRILKIMELIKEYSHYKEEDMCFHYFSKKLHQQIISDIIFSQKKQTLSFAMRSVY